MQSSSESLKRRVEAVLDMAVTTVSSLSEAFTAGVPLQMEDAHVADGAKDKSGSPSLPTIPEEDVSMKDDSKSANKSEANVEDKYGKGVTVNGKGAGEDRDEEGDEDDEDEDDDDAILQVHD